MRFFFFALFTLLVHFGAFGSNCDFKTIERINYLLDENKKVLIIAWSEVDKCEPDNETCADWVDRLNQFKSKQSKKLEIIKISSNKWKKVVRQQASDIPRQSALFLLKGRPSYFYKGPILEFEVYQAVVDAWEDLKSHRKDFLPLKVDVSMCQ